MPASPTAEQLFGPNPWVTDPAPGGTGPWGTYLYNNRGFATVATANTVCQIVELGCNFPKGSCKVIAKNDITGDGGPFVQNQPNQMIQIPDGTFHNAGLIAQEFASWVSIEPINSELTVELGSPFIYTPAQASTTKSVPPTPSFQLLSGKVGTIQQQPDGTYWKHVATAQG